MRLTFMNITTEDQMHICQASISCVQIYKEGSKESFWTLKEKVLNALLDHV